MELCRENWLSLMNQTFIARVVEVNEILLPIRWEGCRIHCISVILRCNMALASSQVQSWDIVCAVAVFELNGLCSSSKSQKLVAHTNTHDWYVRRLHQFLKVINGFLAVGGVARSVGNKHSIEMVCYFMNGIVKGEGSD